MTQRHSAQFLSSSINRFINPFNGHLHVLSNAKYSIGTFNRKLFSTRCQPSYPRRSDLSVLSEHDIATLENIVTSGSRPGKAERMTSADSLFAFNTDWTGAYRKNMIFPFLLIGFKFSVLLIFLTSFGS